MCDYIVVVDDSAQWSTIYSTCW